MVEEEGVKAAMVGPSTVVEEEEGSPSLADAEPEREFIQGVSIKISG